MPRDLNSIRGVADFKRYDPAIPAMPLSTELAKFAEGNCMGFVDLLPVMYHSTRNWNDYILPCDGHWNANGHAAAAQVLEAKLASAYKHLFKEVPAAGSVARIGARLRTHHLAQQRCPDERERACGWIQNHRSKSAAEHLAGARRLAAVRGYLRREQWGRGAKGERSRLAPIRAGMPGIGTGRLGGAM